MSRGLGDVYKRQVMDALTSLSDISNILFSSMLATSLLYFAVYSAHFFAQIFEGTIRVHII